ncbi:hypothetical protein QJS04_geneDACA005324 [Acorus gramineus]|uniref:Uncharacterized protein n=1 Tax=Acorus gramineus TaxID=55184 RepID=A0AAV9AZQ0_ACOGR|nr:hypothetical protein QJS04_geneDACA005324 [Acorus gramineus]
MVVRCDAETEVDRDGMVQKMEGEDRAKRIQEQVEDKSETGYMKVSAWIPN